MHASYPVKLVFQRFNLINDVLNNYNLCIIYRRVNIWWRTVPEEFAERKRFCSWTKVLGDIAPFERHRWSYGWRWRNHGIRHCARRRTSLLPKKTSCLSSTTSNRNHSSCLSDCLVVMKKMLLGARNKNGARNTLTRVINDFHCINQQPFSFSAAYAVHVSVRAVAQWHKAVSAQVHHRVREDKQEQSNGIRV